VNVLGGDVLGVDVPQRGGAGGEGTTVGTRLSKLLFIVLLKAALALLLAVQPHNGGCGAEQDHAEDGAQDAADDGDHVLVLGEG
jgi:hypothetical protein